MTLCTYKGNELPCIAEAKPDSPRQWCPPHEAMLFRDYALAYRRKSRQGAGVDDTWAHSRGLDIDKLKAEGANMTDHTRPLTCAAVADVDRL